MPSPQDHGCSGLSRVPELPHITYAALVGCPVLPGLAAQAWAEWPGRQ